MQQHKFMIYIQNNPVQNVYILLEIRRDIWCQLTFLSVNKVVSDTPHAMDAFNLFLRNIKSDRCLMQISSNKIYRSHTFPQTTPVLCCLFNRSTEETLNVNQSKLLPLHLHSGLILQTACTFLLQVDDINLL